MNVPLIASVSSGAIFAISASWYIHDVAKKRVTVSVGTFFMFTVINTSQLVSFVIEGVWGVVPFTSIGLISAVIVLILALKNRKIYFKLFDQVGLVGALIGFILWQLTNDPALNIYVLSITNFIIFLPLIVKSFKDPSLETSKPWLLNLLASSFLLLTINSTAVVVWIAPVRQFTASLLLNIGLQKNKLRH